jgi:hypothetical protein
MPFFAKAERVETVGAVDREHAIEMIDLVLHQFGTVPFDLHLGPFASQVLIADSNPMGSGDSDQQVGEGETVIPHLEVLIPDIDDFGIDQRPGLTHMDVHHSDRRPDLGSGYAAPLPEPGLPVPQSFPHIIHDDPNSGRARPGNGLAPRAEDGVTKQPDAVNRHRRELE